LLACRQQGPVFALSNGVGRGSQGPAQRMALSNALPTNGAAPHLVAAPHTHHWLALLRGPRAGPAPVARARAGAGAGAGAHHAAPGAAGMVVV